MVEYSAKMQAAIAKYRSLPEKITFSGATVKDRHPILNYEHANSIEEFARDLYSSFRLGDLKGLKTIVVTSPVGDGLAEAIRDRLKKAANF